jgi:hypothetical protein
VRSEIGGDGGGKISLYIEPKRGMVAGVSFVALGIRARRRQ